MSETITLPEIRARYLIKSKRVGQGGFGAVYFAYYRGKVCLLHL